MEEERDQIEALNWQERAVRRVLRDFESAKDFLQTFHDECLDRYEHYRAPKTEQDIRAGRSKSPKFPVPFTTEQVNTLKSRVMQKLFFRNRPCSIYGREKTDEGDAEAKRMLFDYQDRKDDIESKVGKALVWAATSGIDPAQVTHKKEMSTEVVNMDQPITDEAGQPVLDEYGTPVTVQVPRQITLPKYLGSSVEIIDVFDFFFTPEKMAMDDEEPIIVRSRRRPRYFRTKDYFFNQEFIKKREGTDENDSDKMIQRRRILGLEPGDKYFAEHCIYLEWQGYYDPGEDAVDGEGNRYPAGFYVLGVVTGIEWEDTLVRFDFRPFPFDGNNVVVGCFIEELNEILGPRFVDSFHAVQHAQDSIMGLWFKVLKQTVKRPKVVNAEALKNPNQINTDIDETIEVEERDDVNRVVKYVDVPNISPDLYNGLQMLRLMGQNASKVRDQSEGIAQEGVETLGEANILAVESEIGINDYIRTFERTFIQPLYEKRNAINAAYLPAEYVISVVGEKGLEWRTLSPTQIRAEVDFICEAATRENQRGVIAQQIIQTIQPMMNLLTLYVNLGYPPQFVPRVDLLLKELYDVWTWGSDKIEKILPSTAMNQEQEEQLANWLQQVAQMRLMLEAQSGMGSQPGQATQGRNADSARQPQPRTNKEAEQNATQRNTTRVARMQ